MNTQISRLNSQDLSPMVALAEKVLGQEWMNARRADPAGDFVRVYEEERERVLAEVRKMPAEQIGWICSHSTYWGIHNHDEGARPVFINYIGLLDLTTTSNQDAALRADVIAPPGEEYDFITTMEIVATVTLIAFAQDSLWQKAHQERWGVIV